MAFNALTPAEVAPDQPLSTTLLDKIRTNFDDHEARITTGAGTVGEILNGSFETPQGGNPNWPDKWAIGQYAGGQVLLDRDCIHGKYSLRMNHTVALGGGGYAETDYVGVSSLYWPPLNFAYMATAAGMAVEVWARFYAADANGEPSTFLGEKRIYNNTTDNPTFWTSVQIQDIQLAYITARYVKYRFVGGASGSAVTGTVYFDAVGVPIRRTVSYIEPPPFSFGNTPLYYGGWYNLYSPINVVMPFGLRWLVLSGFSISGSFDPEMGTPYQASARFFLNGVAGKYSSQLTAPGGATVQGDMAYDLTGVSPGTYSLQLQFWTQNSGALSAAGSKGYFTNAIILAKGSDGTYTQTYQNQPMY